MGIQPPKEVPEVIAYQQLRLVIGILGIALPIIVPVGAAVIGHFALQSSLSSYYYTNMGDVFVGTLCAIGVFLFSYKGYSDDKGAPGKWACVFAIGVALFPTDRVCPAGCAPHQFSVHLLFAALLFSTLIYYSGVLFRKGDPAAGMTPPKILRNKIYLACAITMAACIAGIALWIFVLEARLPQLVPVEPVFWFEAIAIVAFGFSWLTKSEVIFPG